MILTLFDKEDLKDFLKLKVISDSELKKMGCSGIDRIGVRFFQDDEQVEEINLSDTTSVGVSAFKGCNNLKKASFENVEILTNGVFEDCVNLNEINFPKLKEIGDFTFANTGLEKINFTNISNIGQYCFKNTKIKSANLEFDKYCKISPYLFCDCENLETVVITCKENCSLCGTYFKNCKNLRTVYFNGIAAVDERVFDNCPNLQFVRFDDKLKTIYSGFRMPPGAKIITTNFDEEHDYSYQPLTIIKGGSLDDLIEQGYSVKEANKLLKSVEIEK